MVAFNPDEILERDDARGVLTLFRPATFLPPKTEYMALIYDDWGFQKCIYEPYGLTS